MNSRDAGYKIHDAGLTCIFTISREKWCKMKLRSQKLIGYQKTCLVLGLLMNL